MQFDEEFYNWIENHKDEDANKLRLKYLSSKNCKPWITIAISHIEARKKGESKFINNNVSLLPKILFPSIAVEQASSVNTAIVHAEVMERLHGISELKVLDLTFGLGIDSHAFAEKGFEVTGIEIDKTKYEIALENYKNVRNLKIINEDCLEYLKNCDGTDIVFIDPGRRDKAGDRVFDITQCSPNLHEVIKLIKGKARYLVAKVSPMLDIKHALLEIPEISEVFVIGSKGECKELLLVVDLNMTVRTDIEEIPIRLVIEDLNYFFTFNYNQENAIKDLIQFAFPQVNNYLYIPLAPVQKCGCFNLLAYKFKISAISNSSHVYIGRELINDFPGKCYRVQEIIPWKSANIKILKKRKIQADIIVKNFPFDIKFISSKLGIKPDSSTHLVATTSADGIQYLLLCSKIY